jgi:hypothetical protein
MKFKPAKKEREMAAAAAQEISFGVPVNLELGAALVDLGAESRDGQQVIVMAVDDGEGFVKLELSPQQSSVLSDVLAGLARVGA